MGLNEQIKNSEHKIRSKREEFWFFLFFAISIAWFLPDLIGVKNSSLVDAIQKNGVISGFLNEILIISFVAASIFSIWIYMFFDYKKFFITRKIAEDNDDLKLFFEGESGRGFGSKIEDMLYPKIILEDPIPRKNIDIFHDYLYSKDDKELLFGEEHHSLVELFEKSEDRDFYDFFRVVEASLSGEEKKYHEINNDIDFVEYRAEESRKDGKYIVFSVSAIKTLLEFATDDFERYYKKVFNRGNTRIRKSLEEFNPQIKDEVDVLKMRVIFKFVLFHRIINLFCNIPVGFVNSRCIDYDLRSILSIYQTDGMFLNIGNENGGNYKLFNSDVFTNIFVITYHSYMKNSKALVSFGLSFEKIISNFDPLHSLHNTERDEEEKRFQVEYSNGVLNKLDIPKEVLDNLPPLDEEGIK